MTYETQNILGFPITVGDSHKILEYIKKYLEEVMPVRDSGTKNRRKPLVIATPNPEQIVLATHDPTFAGYLKRADIAIPDGIGIVWASRLLARMAQQGNDHRIRTRVAGVDLFRDLAALAAKEGVTIGLIGGMQGVAVKTLECLVSAYPRLHGWIAVPEEVSEADLADKIQKTGAGVVFVGLGVPKQEQLIDRLRTRRYTHPVVFMSVGGSFDIVSGMIRRAPLIMRWIGLEWFWRLVREPWRWRRQLALLEFTFLVFRALVGRFSRKPR